MAAASRLIHGRLNKGDASMRRIVGTVVATALLVSGRCSVMAAGPDAKKVIDKAIQALGGEAKLAALEAKAIQTKAKVKLRFAGLVSDFTTTTTTMGLHKFREAFKGSSEGTEVTGVTVLNGDKAWRQASDNTSKLQDNQVANQKRSAYLAIVPVLLLPLKTKDFQIESAREATVDDKPAVAVRFIGPDKQDVELFFDRESGLPVKMFAKIVAFLGDQFLEETTFSKYKEFDGVKRATKIEHKRDGFTFMDVELTDLKVLDRVDPKTFAEPN
jgi:hypothetical protein